MNNEMIDMHSHVLYGIDDGSKTKEESIEILKKLKTLGFTSVIATPHYIEGSSYRANNTKKIDIITDIYNDIKNREDMPKIYLGNEVYILSDIEEALKEDKIYTINDTRYLLIEFSFNNKPVNLEEFLLDLRSKNIIPIIAHPERYSYVQKDTEIVRIWIKSGALLQGNYGSIISRYGENAKNTFKYLLKNGYYHFLGTDMHRSGSSFYNSFDEIKKEIKKLISEDEFKKITYDNPKKVINNENIKVEIPAHISQTRKLFSFFNK